VYAKIVALAEGHPAVHAGHLALMAELGEFESCMRGLYLGGNYRGGIAVGDCLTAGESLARRIAGENGVPSAGPLSASLREGDHSQA